MGSFWVRRSAGIAMLLSGLVFSACSAESDQSTSGIAPATSDVPGGADVEGGTATSAISGNVQAPLFDFSSSESVSGWAVVNDTVMGGVSSGRLDVVDGSLTFSGELSLDNNGGFASVRGPAMEPDMVAAWSDRVGPLVRVRGDGRTWTVEVRTDEVSGGWIASLPTSPDSITELSLPWTTFEPVTRFLDPRVADAPLDPRRIVSIAFYLVDGIEGPFRLGLLSIN